MIFFKKKDDKSSQIDETARMRIKESIGSYLQQQKTGNVSFTNKENEELIKQCEIILENDPNNLDALLAKGIILALKMKSKDALGYFEKVLELDQSNLLALSYTATILEGKKDKRASEVVGRLASLLKSMIDNPATNPLRNYLYDDETIKEIYTKPTLAEKHSTGSKLLHTASVMTPDGEVMGAMLTERSLSKFTEIQRKSREKQARMTDSYNKELRGIIRGSVLAMTNKRILILDYHGSPVHEILIDKDLVDKEINNYLNKKHELEADMKEKNRSDSILGKIKGSYSRASSIANITKKDIEVLVKIEKKKHFLGEQYVEIITKRPMPRIEHGFFGRLQKTKYLSDLDFAEKSFEPLVEFLKPRSEEISYFLEHV